MCLLSSLYCLHCGIQIHNAHAHGANPSRFLPRQQQRLRLLLLFVHDKRAKQIGRRSEFIIFKVGSRVCHKRAISWTHWDFFSQVGQGGAITYHPHQSPKCRFSLKDKFNFNQAASSPKVRSIYHQFRFFPQVGGVHVSKLQKHFEVVGLWSRAARIQQREILLLVTGCALYDVMAVKL